jgi:uncharacterized membrane protein
MSDRFGLMRFLGFRSGAKRLWVLTTQQWLWVGVFVSIAVQVTLSVLYYLELKIGTDLGIVNMAEFSASHGHFFYESANFVRQGLPSLLAIHFSWVYFAILPIYALFPSATTLYVIQAVALAAGAVPLYYLAAGVTNSEVKALATSSIYLAWFPIYLGNPDTSHLEPFLPVLLFGTFLLFYRQRYGLGLGLGALAAFTLDGMAIFVALIGVFFLTFPLQAAFRVWRRDRSRTTWKQNAELNRTADATISFRAVVKSFFKLRSVRASIALVAVAAAVFLVMRLLEAYVAVALSAPTAALSVTRVSGFASFGFQYIWAKSLWKTEFWLVAFASVGFLPLLSPRSSVTFVAPWVAYTFLISDSTFTLLTYPHVDIIAFPLFVGVAYAMRRLPLGPSPTTLPSVTSVASVPSSHGALENASRLASVNYPSKRITRAPILAYASVFLVGVIIVANVGLNPVDPLVKNMFAQYHNGPFGGDQYTLNWPAHPGFADVVAVSQLVTGNAYALASPQLWPLMNFDPNAYPLALGSHYYPNLPTNQLPQYVFTEWSEAGEAELDQISQFSQQYHTGLGELVWNATLYGVRAWAPSTPIGPVLLFERGYTGPSETFGAVAYPSQLQFAVGSGLTKSANATISNVYYDGARAKVVSSGALKTGLVWTTSPSPQTFPPGTYTVSMIVNETWPKGDCSSHSSFKSSIPVFEVSYGQSTSPPVGNHTYYYGNLTCGDWSKVSFSLELSSPVIELVLECSRPVAPHNLVLEFLSVSVYENS